MQQLRTHRSPAMTHRDGMRLHETSPLGLHVWQGLALKVALDHVTMGVPLATQVDALLAICTQRSYRQPRSVKKRGQAGTHGEHACLA